LLYYHCLVQESNRIIRYEAYDMQYAGIR